MKKWLTFVAIVLVVGISSVHANTVASSTMWFQGVLTEGSGGVYTGTIDMTAGYYYTPTGPGYSLRHGTDPAPTPGGFDVYAREGGTARVLDGSGNYAAGYPYTILADHDAYSVAGGPWGNWWDPDVPDWDKYELEITADHWYLRYKSPSEKETFGVNPSPMSGAMNWSSMIASETDLGTQHGGHTPGSAGYGGGAGAWDWDPVGWGPEVIPLEYSNFLVTIGPDQGGGVREVSLTPVPLPGAVLLGMLGLGAAGMKLRKYV